MATVTELKNPFVGLRAFEEDEDYLFFGRTAEINDLLKKFGNSRLLAVIGSSGSGKSSLVKSGLLPAIYSGFLSAGRNWRVALLRPGDDPIGNMARELAKDGVLNQGSADSVVPVEPIIESTLRRSTTGLIQAYQQAHFSTPENLLIVIDQFEEVFRYSKYEKQKNSGKSDAMHFVNLLITATRQIEYPVYVLITMRSDFIGDCAEFRGLPESINEGQYLVPRMTRDEIREAINGPIAVGNASITQRLVTRLLNDVGNDLDQLPILQHAMMRTWDAWQNKNRPDTPIDIDDYEKTGGIKMALSLHAEEIFAEITTERERKICELMFKALTDKAADVRGIRRPTSVEDLSVLASATPEEVRKIVEIFRKPGRTFLMPPPNVPLTDKSIIDISHESLMRIWQRLIQWTEEEVRWANIFKRLGNDALNEAKGEASLWGDPELSLGITWRDNFKGDAVRKIWAKSFDVNYELALDFLNRSELADKKQKKERARRARILRWVAVFLILLFASLFAISYQQMQIAKQKTYEADTAKATALRAKDTALLAKSYAEKQRLEADTAKAIALRSADTALKARAEALRQKIAADTAQARALRATDTALFAKEEALREKENARRRNLLSAPNEYARLIREGPTEIKKIIKDSFDYKLIAYCDHLDNLAPLTANLDDKDALAKYNSLVEKLYNNNDLYEKLYSCLKRFNNDEFVIAQSADPYDLKAKFPLTSGSKAIKLIPVAESGNNIITTAASKKAQLAICSTTDNYIYVYRLSDDQKSFLENKIPVGARVTALDYNDESNIIYFGTQNGDIGFIKYANDKKNQPVFQNSLNSRITATKFFKAYNNSYLLVTGLRSIPVVYLLDKDYYRANKTLVGNVYPEKISNEVIGADFDPLINSIKLFTKSASREKILTYLWNPFSIELLNELKKIMQVNPRDNNYDRLTKMMNDPKIKIY